MNINWISVKLPPQHGKKLIVYDESEDEIRDNVTMNEKNEFFVDYLADRGEWQLHHVTHWFYLSDLSKP